MQGFEPWSPGTECQCATIELRRPLQLSFFWMYYSPNQARTKSARDNKFSQAGIQTLNAGTVNQTSVDVEKWPLAF